MESTSERRMHEPEAPSGLNTTILDAQCTAGSIRDIGDSRGR